MDTLSGGMVGRAAPLAELLGLLADARAGHGHAALVLGEPGMGKSTLVEALAGRASGARVGWGWATPDGPPYWPWRTVLDALAAEHPLRADAAAARSPALARYALAAGVRDLLAAVAAENGPLLVILEDLHWADEASVALLRAVVGGLWGVPALIVATARDDPAEAAPDVTAALHDLPTAVPRIPLLGLDGPEVGQIVAQVVGAPAPPELVAQVHERTAGNPFFAREVARLLVARGGRRPAGIPPGVREVLDRRLARLSQPCHRVLGVAAVAVAPGEYLDIPTVARVTSSSPTDVLDVLDEAVRARLLVDDPAGRPRFAHALVREVVEADLPGAERGRLHGDIARALEEEARPDDGAARIAAHWARASCPEAPERAGRWSLAAARDATRHLGFEQAVRGYQRALAAPGVDRLTVLLELGDAQRLAGDVTASRRTLLGAAGLARARRRPAELARAVLGLGGGVAGFEVEVYDETQTELVRDAVAALPTDDSPLLAALLARLSLCLTSAGAAAGDERVALAKRAVAMAARCGDARTEAGALAAYCDAVADPDHIGARLAAAARIRVLAETVDDPVGLLLARRLRVVALLERGEFDAAGLEADAYAREAEALGVPLYRWLPWIWRAMRALLAGDIAGARELTAEADRVGREAGSVNAGLMAFTVEQGIRWMTGTVADFLPRVRAIFGEPWLGSKAGMLAAGGDLAGAAETLRGWDIDTAPRDSEWLANLCFAGSAAVLLGDRTTGAEVYRRLLPYAGLWSVDGLGAAVHGMVAYFLGRVAVLLGEHDAADRLLTLALDGHRAAGAPVLVAMAEGALGELAAARRDAAGPEPATPAEPEPEAADLVREGRIWRVTFRERTATVPDAKGVRDLAVLLARPGREVHVLDLVDPTGTARPAAGDAGELVDARARRAYRRRLTELADEIDEAEAAADRGRLDRLKIEQEFLAAELAAALGLHGRSRGAADPVERARKAVTMRIGTALRAIEETHPPLARHLRLAVATGRFCAYRPESPVRWRVRG